MTRLKTLSEGRFSGIIRPRRIVADDLLGGGDRVPTGGSRGALIIFGKLLLPAVVHRWWFRDERRELTRI